MPTAPWLYINAALPFLPQTRENVIDKLLIAGQIYAEVWLVNLGLPQQSAIAALESGGPLRWLSDAEIETRVARNGRRLLAVHTSLTRFFMELAP
jgi:hypothetical protein